LKLRLSEDFVVDTEDFMREGIRITFLGETGFGKSYGVAVIVEDALEQGALVMIVEPLAFTSPVGLGITQPT